ncbi:MAG TPA: hypothetical protein PKA00_23075 [Saprospiraceae bacterium]|nr:hypothetical protein [Saprospiraceae bacterium]HMQ85811.1 hypothetical protein [Saprospiraceae bacterium]
MKKLSFFFVFVLAVAAFQSCQQEPVDPIPPTAAPELPPVESFVMSFNSFEDADTIRGPYQNWFHAAANIVVWNTALTLTLAVPVASFYASFNSEAQYQSGLTWLWAYDYELLGTTYSAKLYGTILPNDEVEWEMYISQAGGFTDVLWYSGITAFDGSYANWTLYQDGNNPRPFIQADYLRDNGNGVEAIRYTNITPNVVENGDYIEYQEENGATPYDRAYDVFRAGSGNLLEIEWNSIGQDGRVKDKERFQDTNWHCWGSNLMDVACP